MKLNDTELLTTAALIRALGQEPSVVVGNG